MNRLKIVLIVAASLVVVAVVAVALAFSAGVQTWAVRRALAGQPDVKIAVGSVSAGLSSAVVRDVRVEQRGTIVVAREVTAAYSATDYVFGRRINVGSVALRGVEVDLRKAAPSATPPPAAAAAAPFAGILNAVRLPGEVRLGRLDVEAKVLLPDNRTAQLTVHGGGIAPGAFGTLQWKVNFADTTKNAPLTAAQAEGAIKLRTTTDLRIDTIEVNADAAATGPNLPKDHVKLAVKLEQPATNAGENISADIALVRAGAAERLVNVEAGYAAGKTLLAGKWSVAVRSAQFADVLAAFGLPELALKGDGTFSYDIQSGAATAAGAFNGEVSKLEKLGAELAAIGVLKISSAFDGGASRESAQLGKLELNVATADGRKLVAVAAQQKLSFNFKDQRLTPERPGAELARVAITALPLAWAQPVVKPRTIAGGDVSGVFVVEAELDGSRVKARAVEPLVIRAVTVREGQNTLVDRVTLSVSPSVDYTAARIVADAQKLSITTPDGDTLGGALSAEISSGAKPATAFSAQLTGRLAALIKPYLPVPTGPLAVAVNAKGRLEGNALQLSALKVQADREGAGVLAAVEALQPLTIDLKAQKLSAPDAAAPAARVRWGELPLAWVEPFVAQSKLAGQLAAGALEVGIAGADALTVRAVEPLTVRGATVALAGQEWLRAADLTTDLKATWKGGTLSADVQKLELRQGATPLVTASVAAEVTPGKTLRASGRGALSADFAALAKQPALAAQLPLARGAVTAKYDAAFAEGVKVKLSISAQNLVAREGALPLGGMELSVDAALDKDNAGPVRIPFAVVKDGRRSDLLIDGKVGLKPGAISFEGRISGEQLIVDDVQAFAALSAPPPSATMTKAPVPAPAPRPAAPATPRPAAQPARDTTPVWAGFNGRIDLDFKAIKQGPGIALKGLRGALSLRPDKLTIENVAGELNGNPFKVSTILSFDVKQARPYALVGAVDVPGFNVGEFLRRADPSTPPAIETTFTVTSKFNGTAANLPEFADRLTGQFEFKGSKGVLRALNKKAETTSAVTGLLGLAAGLAGQQRLAEGLVGTSELVSLLKDIQFDGITVQVERGADAAIVVKSLELLSPSLRLTGNGRIDHKKGGEFGNNPLHLELQLAAKNELAQGLNKARQLSGKTDPKGYYLMATPFTLGGTVSKPDSSEFWKNLTLNTGANFLR
ncbi:MAG: hypothetical protein HZA93_00570 [Verrucomicrobia bacterium]|nr:hypothetical protein [Verrucomicrobiota bacterium]